MSYFHFTSWLPEIREERIAMKTLNQLRGLEPLIHPLTVGELASYLRQLAPFMALAEKQGSEHEAIIAGDDGNDYFIALACGDNIIPMKREEGVTKLSELKAALAQLRALNPNAPVELFAMDEERLAVTDVMAELIPSPREGYTTMIVRLT